VPAQSDDLPAGKGKDVVMEICTACHTTDLFTSARMTKSGWSELVDKMVGEGANGTDEQLAAIVDYLSTHFGKTINVNKATAKELQSELSFSKDEAEAIVRIRTDKGNFKSLDELKAIPGIDAAKIDDQKDSIAF
jgi:competence protein ComEA